MSDYATLIANLRGERDEPPSEYCKDAANAIEELVRLVGQHDTTGADHMEEMWEHARRADAAEATVEQLKAYIEECEEYITKCDDVFSQMPYDPRDNFE